MMQTKKLFRVSRSPDDFGVNVYIGANDGSLGESGFTHIVKEFPTFEAYAIGEIIRPTFNLSNAEAQQLMNELSQCGFKPTNAITATDGELKATKFHLADIRTLYQEDREGMGRLADQLTGKRATRDP